MPITDQDLQPFINSNPQITLADLRNYYSGAANTQGGYHTVPGGGFGSIISRDAAPGGPLSIAGGPAGSLLDQFGLSDLFGSGTRQSWKPFLGQDGRYYWTNPASANPTPLPTTPGAPLGPNRNYRHLAGNTQAIQDLLPYLTQSIGNASTQGALNDYNTSAITSPLYAQLMTSLYNTYGPQLNAIGNEIQQRNALASANRDLSVLKGPGQDLVNQAYQTAQTFDKPWYDTRAATAGRLSDLFNSIDLSGKLSGTERSEIDKGNALEGFRRGTANAPSATDTVSNAMRFGQAGYQRQQQAKSNLSQAISNASSFLPAAKSGVDVFQVATGRSSTPNPGNSLFPGINQGNSSNQYGLAGSLLGGFNNADINQSNIDANKKDWLDKFNQLAGGIGSIIGSAGKVGGMFM